MERHIQDHLAAGRALSPRRPRAEPSADRNADPVWRALANPLRRRMLDVLYQGPCSTGDLAGRFPELSRFAVMQHLRVLEQGSLVIHRRRGRQRFNYLNPVPIQQIFDRWVSRYQAPWLETPIALTSEVEQQTPGETALSRARKGRT